MTIHCFTSASFSYLDRARVLAHTVRRFHPDWTFWLCLSDAEPVGFSFRLQDEPFDRVVRVEELGIQNPPAWIFRHDVVELCTAVKGPMLERHAVVLTPHVVSPEPTTMGVLDNEIGSLKHGVYNLGFLAVRPCAEGSRFAAWWRERLLEFCFDDVPNGLFTDQRWCDLAPAMFGDVAVLRDRGYNVASWNLGDRPIGIHQDGTITAGDRPLRFFHFTKVNSVGERMLERYAGDRNEVFELLRWYRAALQAERAEGLPDGWWAYGRYADGTPVRREERLAWRARPDVWTRVGNPFLSAPASLREAVGLPPLTA